mgnify:CR=1 FL=1
MEDIKDKTAWYAAKVFFNKTLPIAKELEERDIRSYIPSDVITSLVFFRSSELFAREFQQKHLNQLYVYSRFGTRNPIAIPDEEMELFIFVTSAGQKGLIFLGDDKPEYHVGDLVRVTDGPFKGAEGHIKRIKKDRRLVISIRGVAAIATTFIHPSLLEKV